MGHGRGELVAASAVRDIVIYLIGIALAAMILGTGLFEPWQGAVLLWIYALYVALVLVMANEVLWSRVCTTWRKIIGGKTMDRTPPNYDEAAAIKCLPKTSDTKDTDVIVMERAASEATPAIRVDDYDSLPREVRTGADDHSPMSSPTSDIAEQRFPDVPTSPQLNEDVAESPSGSPPLRASRSIPLKQIDALKNQSHHRRTQSQPIDMNAEGDTMQHASRRNSTTSSTLVGIGQRPQVYTAAGFLTIARGASSAGINPPDMATLNRRLPLRYREYTPTEQRVRDFNAGSLARRQPSMSSSFDPLPATSSRRSVSSEHSATSPLTPAFNLGTLMRSNMSYAGELWRTWKSTMARDASDDSNVKNSGSDLLSVDTTSLPRIHSRTRRGNANTGTDAVVEMASSNTPGEPMIDTTLYPDAMVCNDRCPTCFRCATVSSASNPAAKLLPDGDVPRLSLVDRFKLNIRHTAAQHFLPILWTWHGNGWAARIISLIAVVPTCCLSATVPVVATFDEGDGDDATLTSPCPREEEVTLGAAVTSVTRRRSSRLESILPEQEDAGSIVDNSTPTPTTPPAYECPYGHKVYWMPWRHRWINLIQLLIAPLFIAFASGGRTGCS